MDTAVATSQDIADNGAYVKPDSKIGTFTPSAGGEMPLEVYQAEKHGKYVNELMNVENLLPESVKTSLDAVDNYVNQEIAKRGYDPTTKAYRDVLADFKKDLGIDENTNAEVSIERMAKYIEAEAMLKSLKDLDEEKILKQMRKSPTQDLIALVMAQVEKRGL